MQILESYYISGVCTWQMSEFRSDQRKGYIPGRFPRLSEVEAVVHYNLPHPPVVSIRHPIIVYNIYILLGGDIMYIKNEIFIKQALIHKSFDFQIFSTGLFKFLYKI